MEKSLNTHCAPALSSIASQYLLLQLRSSSVLLLCRFSAYLASCLVVWDDQHGRRG